MAMLEQLRDYNPLRLLVSSPAGIGKSLCLRCYTRCRRKVAMERGGKTAEEASNCTLSAAPTGCAAFHMKYGATTAHRAFGVGVRRCDPWTNAQRQAQNGAFSKTYKRLKRATFVVLDEISMIGRQFLGKIRLQSAGHSGSARGSMAAASHPCTGRIAY